MLKMIDTESIFNNLEVYNNSIFPLEFGMLLVAGIYGLNILMKN
jgi:hypothetical protein